MANSISLLVGLGNPGSQYEKTRHNLGFVALDRLVSEIGPKSSVRPSWKEANGAAICDLYFEDQKVLLVKPLKFMNLSGQPVAAIMNFYKITAEQIAVVHDDLDLPLGGFRIKAGGGDGGHNGVGSIMEALGSRDFLRVKLGIGRPPPEFKSEDSITNWVLGRFSAPEAAKVEDLLSRSVSAIWELVTLGVKSAQTKYNFIPE